MIITQTPLRISLAGGGTDLRDFYDVEDGRTLSFAIDKYVFVIVSERFDDRIYVNYTKKEIVDSVDDIHHDLVREAMRTTGVSSGVEVTMLADIPSEGSGLGSSSSLTVGLLNALYLFRGAQVPADRLAREACEIEIERCGKPIGKQDQYIAAFGAIREFVYRRDGTVEALRVDLPPGEIRRLGSELMLFFTDSTRKSSDILSEQKLRTRANVEHLRQIRNCVPQVRSALESRRFDLIGDILHHSWLLKKKLADNISNPAIDHMYELALSAGATGGKIAGAGGGGFLLLHVPRQRQDAVRNALSGFREFPWLIEQDGSKAIFNLRRYSAR
ncbi:MAG: GHMP kinase [Acidobacteria bacterium]|nr:GHMP kinase [Acidobacteriota bacterium]